MMFGLRVAKLVTAAPAPAQAAVPTGSRAHSYEELIG